MAAPVTGTAVRSEHFAEAMVSTDLHFAGGALFSDREVLLVCVDVSTHLPEDGPMAFTSNAGASTLKGGSGALGIAAMNWLFEHYYEIYLKNGSSAQQWAFQYAVWEIGNDFNGNVSSINFNVGASKPAVDPYFGSAAAAVDPAFVAAYEAMYGGLTNVIPSLVTSYRSTKYTIDFFKNNNDEDQDMVAFVDKVPPPVVTPTPVPTLSQWGVVVLSSMVVVFGLILSRRRQTLSL